jgi:hypothetical protein
MLEHMIESKLEDGRGVDEIKSTPPPSPEILFTKEDYIKMKVDKVGE